MCIPAVGSVGPAVGCSLPQRSLSPSFPYQLYRVGIFCHISLLKTEGSADTRATQGCDSSLGRGRDTPKSRDPGIRTQVLDNTTTEESVFLIKTLLFRLFPESVPCLHSLLAGKLSHHIQATS